MHPTQRNFIYNWCLSTRPDNSAIRDHCFSLDHHFKIFIFEILDSATHLLGHRILKFIYMNSNRELSSNQTATVVIIIDTS